MGPMTAHPAAPEPGPMTALPDMPAKPLVPGNIDLNKRPKVPVGKGEFATVYSMSFSPDGQHEVLIPTVSDDGRMMTEDEAVQTFYRTGRHLGVFADPQSATDYAKRLSERQGEHYGAPR